MSALGFKIKLHSALVTPIMLAGAPRRIAILNFTVCAAFVLGLRAIYVLPISIIIHVIAVLLAKRDPYFFDVFLRHSRQKKFYDV